MAEGTCLRCNRQRPIRSRGLCASCYVVCHRNGTLETYGNRNEHYTKLIEEEMEFGRMNQFRVEQAFHRPWMRIYNTLYKAGRRDLIDAILAETYGTSNKGAIHVETGKRGAKQRWGI